MSSSSLLILTSRPLLLLPLPGMSSISVLRIPSLFEFYCYYCYDGSYDLLLLLYYEGSLFLLLSRDLRDEFFSGVSSADPSLEASNVTFDDLVLTVFFKGFLSESSLG